MLCYLLPSINALTCINTPQEEDDMGWRKYLLFTIFILLPGASGFELQDTANQQSEAPELLKLHQAGRQAHFQTDVDLLLANHPDEFISVRNGKIERPKKADTRKMFEGYFKGAHYYEWDDLEPPIIRVSRDGSMGWVITRVKVRRTQKDSSGAEKEEKFVYAGIMTYEKRDGKWMKVANVSTFQ
jgi:hypothetical protein